MSAPRKSPFLVRAILALLLVLFLGFAMLLPIPFTVPFGGTTATTHELFGSVSTIHFIHDLFFIYSLRVPIEVFGYNAILSGFSWAFVIVVIFGIVQWFLAGMLTQSHKTNLALWGIGVAFLFLTAWLGVRIPPSNVPAYTAFVALEGMVFSLDVLFPLVMFSFVTVGSATLGTWFARRHRDEADRCTPADLARDLCIKV